MAKQNGRSIRLSPEARRMFFRLQTEHEHARAKHESECRKLPTARVANETRNRRDHFVEACAQQARVPEGYDFDPETATFIRPSR